LGRFNRHYAKFATIARYTPREISAAIDRAGGVKEVIIDVVASREEPSHRFGVLLKDARSKIGGTDLLRLEYRSSSENELTKDDVHDVLKAYEDLEAHEVDRLTLVLKDGAKFVGTEKCKVRKVLTFENGVVEAVLLSRMADYLLELQRIDDGVCVLTPDGDLP
jgi:hypothetical protein